MQSEQLRGRIVAADLAWIPLALACEQGLGSALRWNRPALTPLYFAVYAGCTVFAWILLSEKLHLDGFRGGWRLSSVVSHLVLAVGVLIVTLLAVDNLSGRSMGRGTLGVFALLLWLGFLGVRLVVLAMLLRRYRGGDVNRVVILGSDRLATELAVKFNQHPELLCKVIGFLSPKAEIPAPRGAGSGRPLTVSTVEITDLLVRQSVNELIVAHTPASHEILNLVAFCRLRAIRVSLIPQPYELYLSRPRLLDVGGLPLVQLGEASIPASARIGKRILDLAVGLLLAMAALPVVLIFGAALRFTTGRAFRWERRIGWQGKQFSMLRLNVDRCDPPPHSHFAWFLWQFSISELPQFWNVLRGEMSLVGPRPEGPERASRYSTWQRQRLTVKPGMTGLAQVQGLREQHSSEDKTRHDLQYMLRPSLWKDISLLIETIWVLAVRLIRIPASTGVAPPPASPAYSSTQLFPETLQHAHRTQSGSD